MSTAMTIDQVVALLVAVLGGGFLGSLVQGLYQRRKIGADYADVIARSATGLLRPLADRVDELQAQLVQEQDRARQLARALDDALESLERARLAIRVMRQELAQVRKENQPRGRHG
jgi:hypothetical protein